MGPRPVRQAGSVLGLQVNVAQASESQRAALAADSEEETCPHCETDGGVPSGEEPPTQTRSCIQRETVETVVSRLRLNEQADEESIPRGEARGRIVLP